MKLLRLSLATFLVTNWAGGAAATDLMVTPNWGIVCLDEATGTPLWEFFPDRLGYFETQVDAGRVIIRQRIWNGHEYRAPAEGAPKSRKTALDAKTGKVLSGPADSDEDLFAEARRRWRPPTTSAGNRVAAAAGGGKAITILKGAGPEVERIIPTNRYFKSVTVHGDALVIDVPSYNKHTGKHASEVMAIDARTGKIMWKRDVGDTVYGVSDGKDHVYVFERGGVRAVNPRTGRVVWLQDLPRAQSHSRAVENGGNVFAVCTCGWDRLMTFIYCLDADTGAIRWTFDPQSSDDRSLPLIQDGRVYVQIEPNRLTEAIRKAFYCPRSVARDGLDKASRRPACLAERFADKTPEEIELNLRAWHALGDRAVIPILEAAAEVLHGSPLSDLPDSLIATFPAVRRPMALIEFLAAQFEETADLGPEVRRILHDFDPVPYSWRKGWKPFPAFLESRLVLDPREDRIVDAFRAIKARVDTVPTTRFPISAVIELIKHEGTASFAALVAAHDASTDADRRFWIRWALYTHHPRAASDWALTILDEIKPQEICQWVERAPIEWLLDHEELYLGWLHHEDRSVRRSSANRLCWGNGSPAVLPLCVRFLKAGLRRVTDRDVESLEGALRALATHNDREHIALLRRYMSPAEVTVVSPGLAEGESAVLQSRLRDAAERALKELGIAPPLNPPPIVHVHP